MLVRPCLSGGAVDETRAFRGDLVERQHSTVRRDSQMRAAKPGAPEGVDVDEDAGGKALNPRYFRPILENLTLLYRASERSVHRVHEVPEGLRAKVERLMRRLFVHGGDTSRLRRCKLSLPLAHLSPFVFKS